MLLKINKITKKNIKIYILQQIYFLFFFSWILETALSLTFILYFSLLS